MSSLWHLAGSVGFNTAEAWSGIASIALRVARASSASSLRTPAAGTKAPASLRARISDNCASAASRRALLSQ